MPNRPFIRLLRPPRRRRPSRSSGGGMSAKDQRQIIGLILFLVGLFMAVIGAFKSYSDYHSLNSTQLALKTASDILAPDVGITGVGLFLLVLGLIIFFAPSNKAA